MKDEIKTIFDAGCEIDAAIPPLRQALSALLLTLEAMEDDGFPATKKAFAASIFAARFPMYDDTFRLILRDMEQSMDSLQAGVDRVYQAGRKQMEAAEGSQA